MSTFVLVHGSFHGAWCWDDVRTRLEARGHRVIAVDLPGRGRNPMPVEGCTLEAYAEVVCRALDAAETPAVLVAHSMGGVVATQAAEMRPERIARLVYVCAFLPRDGQALLDLATTDAQSAILPTLIIDEAAGVHSVRREARVQVFYDDCPSAIAEPAAERLIPEPLAPVSTPVRVTAERYGRVPRAYVRATRDRCLTPELQDRMIAAAPCERVVSIESSHSPFFSRPDELTEHLVSLAR